MITAPRQLEMWTVYHDPIDYPDKYVARLFLVDTKVHPTDEMFVADTLQEIHALLPYGLLCIPRHSSDDPVIVEVWL